MEYTAKLIDEGTMDTVIAVYNAQGVLVHRERFDCEFASSYRTPDGTLTQEGFTELSDMAIDSAIINAAEEDFDPFKFKVKTEAQTVKEEGRY